MKLTYWGTAAAEGLPALFCDCDNCRKAREVGGKCIRSRSQALINDDLLIDFGPDTYMHMLQNKFHLTKIKNVLITHCHEDHFYIDDVFTRIDPMGHVDDVMNLYGNDMLYALYQHNVLTRGIRHMTEKVLRVNELKEFEPAKVGDYEVIPLLADHNPAEKCFIYIIQQEGKSVLYAHDTGYFKDEVWEFLKGRHFDLISLDCNHQTTPIYHNHMGIACCVEVKERLQEMKCIDEDTICILNHFSHNDGGIQEELEEKTKGTGFLVAYDGMAVEI